MTHAVAAVAAPVAPPKRSVIKFDEVGKFRGTRTPSAQDSNVNSLII